MEFLEGESLRQALARRVRFLRPKLRKFFSKRRED
jgi:hypothetical protein